MPPAELQVLQSAFSGMALFEATVLLAVLVGALFAGSILVPGASVRGESCTYKINGLRLFLLTALIVGLAQVLGWFSLAVLHTHFAALFVVTNLFAFAFSLVLYWQGRHGQETGQGLLRGFFFGTTLNPAWLGVDLKFFSYRPSLIGLALLNASFAVVQYETYGQLSLAMVLYQCFTFLYIFNYFQFEQGMIHTWDIVSERFGWMLVWGDYVLVPFFYCIAGWWLVHATEPLTATAATAIVMLYIFGFWLFRGANQQKHRFKRDPAARIWGRPARTLDGRLLVSGFWGIGRHLNYTGEICIYLAFTLTTGLVSWVPFLLPAWLAVLLSHRSRRDERRCHAKYGELWGRYKQQVRYSMLPFVY